MFFLAVLLVAACGYAQADVSSVVDELLKDTFAMYPSTLPFEDLDYVVKEWVQKKEAFDIKGDFNATGGELKMKRFTRNGKPNVWGASPSGILEARFFIDLEVSYKNYTALNFHTKERVSGPMTLTFKGVEIFSWVGLEINGTHCKTTVKTYTPISMPHATTDFGHQTSELPGQLYDDAKYSLEYSLNRTVTETGRSSYEKAANERNLCVLLL